MELVRVTIVSWNKERVFDELCLTEYPVLDLNSRFSGIESLDGARLTLDKIHAKLKTMITPDTILVGHGLENDLKALRLIHRRVIDTAHLFPHPKGFPFRYSLKALVKEKLGRFIQTSAAGHDPMEDAVGALDLIHHVVHKSKTSRRS